MFLRAVWGGGLRLDSIYPLVCADVQAGGDNVEFLAVEKGGGRWGCWFLPSFYAVVCSDGGEVPAVSTGNNSLIAPMIRVGKYV